MSNNLEKETHIYHPHNIQIDSPEKLFFNIDGKIQSLYQYLSPLTKLTETTTMMNEDFSEIIGKPAKIYFEARQGNIYFDTNFNQDNIIGYFSGLFISCSCPKLINPKVIAEMFIAYSNRESYKKNKTDSNLNTNNSEDVQNTIEKYILNAKTRKESDEPVSNTFMYYETLELIKSFYTYLEKFKVN